MVEVPVVDKNPSLITKLFNYALVGIAINFSGYMFYLLFTYFGATPKITMTLLYGVGVAVGFWGNRKLTFAHKGSLLGSGVRYLIAHCFGYFINLALLIIFVDHFMYAHQWVQALAIFVVAGFLFLVFKYFVFTDLNASNVDKL